MLTYASVLRLFEKSVLTRGFVPRTHYFLSLFLDAFPLIGSSVVNKFLVFKLMDYPTTLQNSLLKHNIVNYIMKGACA